MLLRTFLRFAKSGATRTALRERDQTTTQFAYGIRPMCHLRLTALVLFATLAAAGCKSIGSDWSQHLPWADSETKQAERNYQQPVRMVAIWSPAVYNQPGKPPTRGFGGRLYFYNGENV